VTAREVKALRESVQALAGRVKALEDALREAERAEAAAEAARTAEVAEEAAGLAVVADAEEGDADDVDDKRAAPVLTAAGSARKSAGRR